MSATALRTRLARFIEARSTQRAITLLIVLNAVVLGLETSERAMAAAGELLRGLDSLLLGIFVLEILAKLAARGLGFWRDPWNVFDFFVIAMALLPATGPLAVLRALRVLRVLRLISQVPSMRGVVEALLRAIPGMGSIVALLALLYYVAAVMATKLFGDSHPVFFGTLGDSAYTLFQIMTLESWSGGIVRPVMEQHPQAWIFFIVFILVTTFAVLNLFIAIIVNAMQEKHESEHLREVADANQKRQDLAENMAALRLEVAELKALLLQGVKP